MAEAGPVPALPVPAAPVPARPGPAGALPLLVWLSPAFPVGAYAYSHGLEWAVDAGDVRDEASLVAWLSDLLDEGLGRNDSILLSAAHRAVSAGDEAALDAVNDLALALASSAELRLETSQQGRSFLDTVAAAWPAEVPWPSGPAGPGLSDLARHSGRFDEVAYPVAVGIASAAHGLDRTATVGAYLTALAGTLVSAAIRLAPIGQTAGQRVLARLLPALVRLRDATDRLGPDDVGSATLRSDLGSLRHETQYTRIFRS